MKSVETAASTIHISWIYHEIVIHLWWTKFMNPLLSVPAMDYMNLSWRIPLGIRSTFDCWQNLCIWALTAVCCAAALRTCLLTSKPEMEPQTYCLTQSILDLYPTILNSLLSTILYYTNKVSNPKQNHSLASRDAPPRKTGQSDELQNL